MPSIISTASFKSPSGRASCSSTHGRRRHEAAAHRALARTARFRARAERLQRPRVPPRGHADEHLLVGTLAERVEAGEVLPRRERQLAPLDAAHARTLHFDAATAHRQLARNVAHAVRAVLAVLVARPAQRLAVGLQHRAHHAEPRAHHQLVQPLGHYGGHVRDQRQRSRLL